MRLHSSLLIALFAAGCSSDDTNDKPTTGEEPGPYQPAEVDLPAWHGVVYAVHAESNDLIWYRLDGDTPHKGGELQMPGDAIDAAVDRDRDLLFVALGFANKVAVFELSQPESPAQPVAAPVLVTEIELPYSPFEIQLDPIHHRLYAVQVDLADARPESWFLSIVDVSVRDAPQPLPGSPHTIPTVDDIGLDPARRVLFAFNARDSNTPEHVLLAYDVATDAPVPLRGEPILLQSPDWYPSWDEDPLGSNNNAFRLRNLEVDPYNARLYAARREGRYSELAIITYPGAPEGAGNSYSDLVTMDDLGKQEDPFDIFTPIGERPNINDAKSPALDPIHDMVFLFGHTWRESNSLNIGIMVSMTGDPLQLGPGCQDYEGFGCWSLMYVDGSPVLAQNTVDGPSCVDADRKVVVAATDGSLMVWTYDTDGSMQPWLPENGTTLLTGSYPVKLICH